MSEPRKNGHRTSGRGAGGQIVGLAICPAVALKARLLGIVSAEFITEELAAWGAPRLQFAVHDWQRLDAERTACRCVAEVGVCVHQVPRRIKPVAEPCVPCVPMKMISRPGGFPSPVSINLAQLDDDDCCGADTCRQKNTDPIAESVRVVPRKRPRLRGALTVWIRERENCT